MPLKKHIQIASELGDLVERLLQQPLKPTEDELAQAEVLAQKLVFPEETRVYGYQTLGTIEALRRNFPKTSYYFNRVSQVIQNEYTPFWAIYAQALRYLGRIKDSNKQLNFYLENKTTDVFSLKLSLTLCIIYGQTTKAEQFMQQIKKLDPKAFLTEHKADIEFVQLWQNTGIPENAILDYLEYAYQFAYEKGINLRHIEIIPDTEDEHSFMYIFRDNDLTTEQRLQYEQELDKHMFSYLKTHRDYPFDNILFFIGRYKENK